MGITTENYFEYIYSVIFSPKSFFEDENIQTSARLAIGTVVLVTLFTQIGVAISNNTILETFFVLSLLWKVCFTVVCWFITGLFFEYIAKIFDKNGGLSKILFYSAFAAVPFIFFAPLDILKNTGSIGFIIGSNAEILLYLWIIYLYANALKSAYGISLSRAFMLISVPFIGLFFAFSWTIGFFTKLWYIFSI